MAAVPVLVILRAPVLDVVISLGLLNMNGSRGNGFLWFWRRGIVMIGAIVTLTAIVYRSLRPPTARSNVSRAYFLAFYFGCMENH